MPPQMITPSPSIDFHGLAGTFTWQNGHAPFLPPHHTRLNVAQWRVKVGSSQYGFDYYFGLPINDGPVLSDPNVTLAGAPPSGTKCWALVEWVLTGSSSWNLGTPTSFTLRIP